MAGELKKWKPFNSLWREVDRYFDSLFRRFDDLFEFEVPSIICPFNVKVDVSEDENNIYIEADIPNFDKKDIEVKLDGILLTITAKKEKTKEEKKRKYHYYERRKGEIKRSVIVPAEVTSKAEAKYENGVLKITLEKKEKGLNTERKIEIQ